MKYQDKQYLADLPEPTVFKDIDFEKELAEIIAYFLSRNPSYNEVYLESDPIKKVFESWAYDRVSMKNAYNEDLKQMMLSHSTSSNLDVAAANVVVERRVIKPEDPTTNPPTPAIMEDDESLRYRAQTVERTAQVAGPKSGYERLAIEASVDVKEAVVPLPPPVPGQVHVYVRSRTGNGQADKTLLKIVTDFLNPDEVRPLNDTPIVKSGVLHSAKIVIGASYYKGYDPEAVNKNAKEGLLGLNDSLRFGNSLTHNLIHATARVSGIKNIHIKLPKGDIDPEDFGYVLIDDVEIEAMEVEES